MGDTVARAFGVVLTGGGLRCDVALHVIGDTVVIEGEPCVDDPAINAGAMVRGMIARLQQTSELRTFYRVAAREMRAITGFDRVMIYRFDHDGSGEVIAESARAGLESYLGLHYPASDIPRQARILYERNWLRIIPDVNAPPAAIEPQLDSEGHALDLSMSILRSVSPVHVEYLKNMGVAASMSVSILRQGKLWGLLACHHYTPHHVSFARRTAAELFGQMFSLLMESRERDNESASEARAQKLHHQLITVMAAEAIQFESIVTHLDDLADLLACDGIGIWINDRATLKGLAPDEAQFAKLIAFLADRNISEIFARHDIGAEYPPGRAFADRAAGMMVVPLSRPARDYLVFFRREIARSVNWAGDPAKPVTSGPEGARLTPRKSFELWRETVSGQSPPWLPVECRIAESLRVSLLEVILRLSDLTETERRRAQERQELLIAELNHRVRNILGLIRGVITQSKDSATDVESFTKVLGGRVHALAMAHDQITADNWGPASFRGLINAEAGAYLADKAERVVVSGPDVLIEPQAFTTVALVIHEMITNSAKYGALSDNRGRVEIATALDALGRLTIDWAEHGGPRGETADPAWLRQHRDRAIDPPRSQGRRAGRIRGRRPARVVHDPGGLRPRRPRRGCGRRRDGRGVERRHRRNAEGRPRRRGQHDHRARCRGHHAQIRRRHGADRKRRGAGAQGDLRSSPGIRAARRQPRRRNQLRDRQAPGRGRSPIRVRDRVWRAGRVSPGILRCSQAAQAILDRLAARGGRTPDRRGRTEPVLMSAARRACR